MSNYSTLKWIEDSLVSNTSASTLEGLYYIVVEKEQDYATP